MISGFPSFNLLQKKHTRPPKKKQQPLWDVPTCKPVSCTATIAFIVREGSSRSKARRLYLGPTTGGTQKHSGKSQKKWINCKCCWRQKINIFCYPFCFIVECQGLLQSKVSSNDIPKFGKKFALHFPYGKPTVNPQQPHKTPKPVLDKIWPQEPWNFQQTTTFISWTRSYMIRNLKHHQFSNVLSLGASTWVRPYKITNNKKHK